MCTAGFPSQGPPTQPQQRAPTSPHAAPGTASTTGPTTWSCSVLEPCDVAVLLKDQAGEGGGGEAVVKLDVSDLSIKMSPDVLQLVCAVSVATC